MDVSTVVVVPALDEEDTIGACLRALAQQTVGIAAFETIVVLDACRDRTSEVVRVTAQELGLRLRTLPGPGAGAGAARRTGMEAAASRLLADGRPDGLIACTDADSRPARDWLERQLAYTRRGARAIAGWIELDPAERDLLPPAVLRRRERAAAHRLLNVRRIEPGDFGCRAIGMSHDFTHLANLGFYFAEIARHRKFGEAKPLRFQQLPGRALVEQAGDDDIGLQHQDILGAARQNRIAASVFCREGLPGVARIPAEPDDLRGIRQRYQELIGADVHRGHARLAGRQRRRGREHRKRSD